MGPNVSCTLAYEWHTPIVVIYLKRWSVTPLYRCRCVSILHKLYTYYNKVSLYLNTLIPCYSLPSPSNLYILTAVRAWSLVVSPLTQRQVLVLVFVLKFGLKSKRGCLSLLHIWRSVKIMCHTGAGVDMEPAVDFCIPMFVGQQNVTEGHSKKLSDRVLSSHINKDGALVYSAWERGLSMDHSKRDYILQGVAEGFHITYPSKFTEYQEVENYRSATGKQHRSAVEKQIKAEVRNQRYQIVSQNPKLVSALGAIPKTSENSAIRIIYDVFRPDNTSPAQPVFISENTGCGGSYQTWIFPSKAGPSLGVQIRKSKSIKLCSDRP